MTWLHHWYNSQEMVYNLQQWKEDSQWQGMVVVSSSCERRKAYIDHPPDKHGCKKNGMPKKDSNLRMVNEGMLKQTTPGKPSDNDIGFQLQL